MPPNHGTLHALRGHADRRRIASHSPGDWQPTPRKCENMHLIDTVSNIRLPSHCRYQCPLEQPLGTRISLVGANWSYESRLGPHGDKRSWGSRTRSQCTADVKWTIADLRKMQKVWNYARGRLWGPEASLPAISRGTWAFVSFESRCHR